jgi:predicted GIY-YIG superfamily endonuclease
LINVPVKRLAVHVAALRRIFRADKRPVRVIAKELGVSHSTLLAAEKAIRAKFPKAKKPILQR